MTITTTAPLEFRILGPLRVSRVGHAGHAVQVEGVRQRRLLGTLLLHANTPLSFDRIAGQLWADPPQTAKHQVHNAVAHLRRTLHDAGSTARIDTVDATYELRVDRTAVDAEVFKERLQAAEHAEACGRRAESVRLLDEALRLWNGPALDGLADGLRARTTAGLDALRLLAMERLAVRRLARGEERALAGDLAGWVAAHPLSEPLCGMLMLTLYRCGRRPEALQEYERLRTRLAEEYGVDPGTDVAALHLEILRSEKVGEQWLHRHG